MAVVNWPQRDAPLSAANGSAEAFASEDLSDGMESLHLMDHLDSPHLTLHDFHKFHHSPLLATSPDLEYRHVRRKSSSADLTTAHTRYTDPAIHWPDDVVWTPSLILPRTPHTTSHSDFSPPPLHYRPLTPRPRTYTASPSLSSTVDTVQSSPFQTPVNQGRPRVEHEGARTDFSGPIRVKRKFDSLKRAKRLPHSSNSSSGGQGELWEVYAAVFSLEEDIEQIGERAELSKGKSVRFETTTGTGSSLTDISVQVPREERGGHPTSSVSLSRIDWPLPPSHDNWQGTFGHLNTSTPPSTPATVLYRGASFDVLNPHASLVLGPHNLETPAEIDGLLDSYFEEHTLLTQDSMRYNTAAGDSSPTSSHAPSESSRRILYDNAEIAHRNILGTRDNERTQVTPPPRALLSASGSHNRGRPFSDPFDLTVSEDGSSNTLLTINHVLEEGRRSNAAASPRMQPLGLGITDPDETHATSDQTTNPTIKGILNDYEYTRVPSFKLSSQLEDLDIGTSPAIEHGRCDLGQHPSYQSSHGLLSPLQTPEYQRTPFYGVPSHGSHGPAPLPTPPQPIYSGIQKPSLYYTDCSDLPNTDQSYGNTKDLLNITPETAEEIPPYAPYAPCSPATCVDPAHIHPYEDDPNKVVTPCVQHYDHDDKENIPPGDYRSPCHAAVGMHGDQDWRFNDGDSDDGGDLGRAMPRSSSFYPDDGQSCWITEADPSQINLRDMQRCSAMSADSYANTSFVESHHRFSFQSPTGQTTLPPVPEPLSIVTEVATRKPDKSILKIADRRNRAIQVEIDALQSKIAQEQVALGYSGSPKIDSSQRRADLARLEHLRDLLPATTQPFVFKANESAETIKLHPPSKLQKAQTFVRAQHLPKPNFSRTLGLGQHDSAFNSGSDTRGLLASPATPSPYMNFGYSESTGTFMTVQQESPIDVRGPATNLWSPFEKDPTNRAIYVKSPVAEKPMVVDLELGPVGNNSKRSHRAAIGSQYEPRELHLIKQKRFTDAQLLARSPGWTTLPTNRDFAGHYAQSSTSTYRMLGKPGTVMDKATRMEQKRISKRFAYPCYVFPPLALAFGLGCFDKSIAQRTYGRVTEACPKEKRRAYTVGFPLGMMFWGVFVISVYLMVKLVHPSKQSGSPIQ